MSEREGCRHCAETSDEHHYYPSGNEDGWRCGYCRAELRYRPDLDRALLADKVRGLLMDLHVAKLVYVSNNDHGAEIVRQVTRQCQEQDRRDQITILRAILAVPSIADLADYWAARASGAVAP